MCQFHAPSARWECREHIESRIQEKEKRNFCDWFRLDPRFLTAGPGDEKGRTREDAAKSRFDALFGGK